MKEGGISLHKTIRKINSVFRRVNPRTVGIIMLTNYLTYFIFCVTWTMDLKTEILCMC